MKRQNPYKPLLASFLACFLLTQNVFADKPNIIFIMAEHYRLFA